MAFLGKIRNAFSGVKERSQSPSDPKALSGPSSQPQTKLSAKEAEKQLFSKLAILAESIDLCLCNGVVSNQKCAKTIALLKEAATGKISSSKAKEELIVLVTLLVDEAMNGDSEAAKTAKANLLKNPEALAVLKDLGSQLRTSPKSLSPIESKILKLVDEIIKTLPPPTQPQPVDEGLPAMLPMDSINRDVAPKLDSTPDQSSLELPPSATAEEPHRGEGQRAPSRPQGNVSNGVLPALVKYASREAQVTAGLLRTDENLTTKPSEKPIAFALSEGRVGAETATHSGHAERASGDRQTADHPLPSVQPDHPKEASLKPKEAVSDLSHPEQPSESVQGVRDPVVSTKSDIVLDFSQPKQTMMGLTQLEQPSPRSGMLEPHAFTQVDEVATPVLRQLPSDGSAVSQSLRPGTLRARAFDISTQTELFIKTLHDPSKLQGDSFRQLAQSLPQERASLVFSELSKLPVEERSQIQVSLSTAVQKNPDATATFLQSLPSESVSTWITALSELPPKTAVSLIATASEWTAPERNAITHTLQRFEAPAAKLLLTTLEVLTAPQVSTFAKVLDQLPPASQSRLEILILKTPTESFQTFVSHLSEQPLAHATAVLDKILLLSEPSQQPLLTLLTSLPKETALEMLDHLSTLPPLKAQQLSKTLESISYLPKMIAQTEKLPHPRGAILLETLSSGSASHSEQTLSVLSALPTQTLVALESTMKQLDSVSQTQMIAVITRAPADSLPVLIQTLARMPQPQLTPILASLSSIPSEALNSFTSLLTTLSDTHALGLLNSIASLPQEASQQLIITLSALPPQLATEFHATLTQLPAATTQTVLTALSSLTPQDAHVLITTLSQLPKEQVLQLFTALSELPTHEITQLLTNLSKLTLTELKSFLTQLSSLSSEKAAAVLLTLGQLSSESMKTLLSVHSLSTISEAISQLSTLGLSAKSIGIALQFGASLTSERFDSFVKLLSTLPPQQTTLLLEGLGKLNFEQLSAIGSFLNQLSEEHFLGFFAAMANQPVDEIRAFFELIRSMPPKDIVTLLQNLITLQPSQDKFYPASTLSIGGLVLSSQAEELEMKSKTRKLKREQEEKLKKVQESSYYAMLALSFGQMGKDGWEALARFRQVMAERQVT